MIMKKSNFSKMASAALMMTAAMAMTSCASSKKINGDSNASKSNDMGKNEEDLDGLRGVGSFVVVFLFSMPAFLF